MDDKPIKARKRDIQLTTYCWACATCQDEGGVNQDLGWEPTSGWVECPDCGNPHKGTHP